MKKTFTLLTCFLVLTLFSKAQNIPFGEEQIVYLLNEDLSGESAKRNLEYISRLHRMRGSDDYNEATAFIQRKLEEYGLESIELIQIPADGETFYGTQKSRPAWNVSFAELWEMREDGSDWVQDVKIADWLSIPMVVAQDSYSGEAQAELVDVGSGTSESDYQNQSIGGKLVLTSSQPGAIVPLAVEKYGAVGIVSYAQNQVTAWWKEDENLIRWGHLETFSETETFGFMISLKQARSFQERLSKGETIMLDAKVIARKSPGTYDILTATIEGSDSDLKNEEIAFSCHLDHPRPGANDNASGCVAILEVARTLKKLIDEGKLERPKRTIRFIWSPEIEGTTSLLNFRPEFAQSIKFNIHMDMVGGNQNTKALFHVSRNPLSLPSFIQDVGESYGEFLNEASDLYASGDNVKFPMVSNEGGKEALNAVLGKFNMGSDHQVFVEGSFRIPAIYLHDWPDRYIHTNYDTPANIDPTKLKRSAFIGAASAYFLAALDESKVENLVTAMKTRMLGRIKIFMEYSLNLEETEKENALYYFWEYEQAAFESVRPFARLSDELEKEIEAYLSNLKMTFGAGRKIETSGEEFKVIYSRNPDIKGPMGVFGYNYFTDHYSGNRPAIFGYSGIRGSGGQYAYEALNLVNGARTIQEIRNILSLEFGPIPSGIVLEYLQALESINVVVKQ